MSALALAADIARATPDRENCVRSFRVRDSVVTLRLDDGSRVGPEAEPGRGVVAFGSNHGNEYEGPVALKHLMREIHTEDVRGRIILIPVLNAPASRSCSILSAPCLSRSSFSSNSR